MSFGDRSYIVIYVGLELCYMVDMIISRYQDGLALMFHYIGIIGPKRRHRTRTSRCISVLLRHLPQLLLDTSMLRHLATLQSKQELNFLRLVGLCSGTLLRHLVRVIFHHNVKTLMFYDEFAHS